MILCFDLDGTLCNSWEGARSVDSKYQQFILKSGFDHWDIRKEYVKSLLDDFGINQGDFVELFTLFKEESLKTLQLYPEVLEVLSSLQDRYKLCILTNGASGWQREKVELLGLSGFFISSWFQERLDILSPVLVSLSH